MQKYYLLILILKINNIYKKKKNTEYVFNMDIQNYVKQLL